MMTYEAMAARVADGEGFFAALDQSGGSTPGALRGYGISDTAYHDDAGMFRLMHEMRLRIMTAPAFSGDKVIGAILFERTMDGDAQGKPVPAYLWEERGIVPFLKIDKGLEDAADGVRLMKPITDLEPLLDRAVALGVFGTKMRSVIDGASETGITAIVAQQFAVAEKVMRHDLVPILEPEVSIGSPDKAQAEVMLVQALHDHLDMLPGDRQVMLKVTIPEVPDLYAGLIDHPSVMRVVALSGGYSREDACRRLAANHGLIASFSRALLGDLKCSMNDAEFDAALGRAVDEIYRASTVKTAQPAGAPIM